MLGSEGQKDYLCGKLKKMKKYLWMISIILLGCTSGKEEERTVSAASQSTAIEKSVLVTSEYSESRDSLHPYPIHDAKGHIAQYGTFERYMWDEGFPDTIIVPFIEKDKYEGYVKAIRQGLLEDSLGNYYSPAYVYMVEVGDSWVYDIKGCLVESTCTTKPHSGQPHTHNR